MSFDRMKYQAELLRREAPFSDLINLRSMSKTGLAGSGVIYIQVQPFFANILCDFLESDFWQKSTTSEVDALEVTRLRQELDSKNYEIRNLKMELSGLLDECPEHQARLKRWRELMNISPEDISKEDAEELQDLTDEVMENAPSPNYPEPAEKWMELRTENEWLKAELESLGYAHAHEVFEP